MSWLLILCVLTVCVASTRSFRIAKRSPEEHVPHEGRFEETGEMDQSDYPPLRGIEPALPPHLRYLEAPSTEYHLTRMKANAEELKPVDENSASARKLIEDNSTFDVTSGNITINDQAGAITENFGGDGFDFNATQTFGTTAPETLITMKASHIETIDFASLTSTKKSSMKRSSSNRQPGRSLSDRQPISKATTTRYVNNTNSKKDRRKEELSENIKGKEKVANKRNDDDDSFQSQPNTEITTSTQMPQKVSTTTESQDDIVDGFMNRIQDHWIEFVQHMKHSVMDVWQTITSRIMNSLENFSLSTH